MVGPEQDEAERKPPVSVLVVDADPMILQDAQRILDRINAEGIAPIGRTVLLAG